MKFKYLKYSFYVLTGFVALVLAWGVGIEPRLIDERHEIAEIPGLPSAWDGKQIGLIADIQFGMWLGNTDTVRRMVARLVEKRPALVLIAGDFIYQPTDDIEELEELKEATEEYEIEDAAEEIKEAVNLVRPLSEAGIPTYAVLGNHDYAMETPKSAKMPEVADRLTQALEAAGIKVLKNQSVSLTLAESSDRPESGTNQSGTTLYLAGLGPHYPHQDDPQAALLEVPDKAPVIVLMHNPDSLENIPGGRAPLALAAHTHGGQIRLPFLPRWSWLTLVWEGKVHADGWIKDFGQPGNRLYVNRGIGFSKFPIRINCPPELTIFTLKPGS